MNLSRRQLLQSAAGAAALFGSGLNLRSALAQTSKKIPIALQLYSVRDQCGKDLPGVISAVAAMGYKGVEFAGYYGRNAKDLRKLLDDHGLVCCGTHTGLNTLLGDALKGTIEFNQTLGNPNLIVPGMGADRLGDEAKILETAKLFNELAAKVKDQGMRVGYHAHGGDFRKVGDSTEWDLFFGNTNKDVVMQMDTGNCLGGGGNPYELLKKYPGRAITIHLKEHGGPKGACVGEGTVKWDEVFQLCETIGATQWYIVEQESYAGGPLDAVKQCFENLKKMGKC
jgi:sugar phosphate isomerase/epimerase